MVKIVERIQKCNHPKLNPANKSKMEVRESQSSNVGNLHLYTDSCLTRLYIILYRFSSTFL
jgi:hypothetical protein